MQPVTIATLAFAMPFIAAHGSLLISAYLGAFDWCFPYYDGCVSISKAARESNALFFFRGITIASSFILITYWVYVYHYIHRINPSQQTAARTTALLGSVAAVFLVLYADYLGTEGDFYRLMRRYGVTFYFTFTVLAQMIFTRLLFQNPIVLRHEKRLLKLLLYNCWLLLVIGLCSLAVNLTLEGAAKDRWENVVEWFFGFFMSVYFLLTARLWQKEQFHIEFRGLH